MYRRQEKSSRTNASSGDQTVEVVKVKGRTYTLASVYLPYDEGTDVPSGKVQALIIMSQQGKTNLILGCDANAHHTIWGNLDTNSRGEILYNYIFNTNLTMYM